MTKQCTVRVLDEVNCVITNLHSDHIDHFYTAYGILAPNYYFNPKYKLGTWDGKIRYFHKTGKTYVYLLNEIIPKLVKLGYKVDIDDCRTSNLVEPKNIDATHFDHISDPETGEPIRLRPYQEEAVNAVINNSGGIILAGTGAGKAQPLDCKIRTPSGWKLMGNMAVGDKVINPSHGTATVIGVFPQGIKDIYEIEFHDGSTTRCCEDHLWETRFPKQLHKAWTESKVITTRDIISFIKRKQTGVHTPGNISIPLCQPIEHESQNLPLDPYALGLLLGGGCLKSVPVFTSADNELIEAVKNSLSSLNVTLKYTGRGYDYRISKPTRNNRIKNELTDILERLNLFNTTSYTKFIPDMYKTGSIKQRIALLQGLMDTDGTPDKRGNCSYSTTSMQLAKDVQELCWSLGMICTITDKISNIGTSSKTLFIRCDSPKMLFRLSRKRNRCRDMHGDGRIELTRRVKNVQFVGQAEAQCIMLDSENHLYITDDYIVTHNTLMNAALVDQYGKLGLKTITVVPSSDLVEQTKIEFLFWGLDTGEYSGDVKDTNHTHVVSTWQALQNNPSVLHQFNLVVVDECHGVKGNVLTKLLNENGRHIAYRFGLTGTLPKAEADAMSVRCAIGDVQYSIPAHELIKQGWLAKLDIDIVQLEEDFQQEYDEFKREHPSAKITYNQFKDAYLPEYTVEKRYLQTNQERMQYIKTIIEEKRDERKGNVFCLVDGINFGKKLAKMIPGAVFVHGKDKKKARREVYNLFKENDNLVVIATIQVASTGLNIKRIFNLMFIDVGKSFIRIIQTIGRGLRKAPDKDSVQVTDVCSDLKYSKKHVRERIKFYTEALYPHKKRVVKYKDVVL